MINSVRQYLERVVDILFDKRDENAVVDIDGPRYFPGKNGGQLVLFRARVEFENGHVLQITDDFLIQPSGEEWSRKFAYFFGAPGSGERQRIFLFDNHGLFGEAEHLDLGGDIRLEEGDPRLNGFSPRDVDVLDVCRFIDLYFSDHPFPWVTE